MEKQKQKQIGLYMTPELDELVTEVAEKSIRTKSQYINFCVVQQLIKEGYKNKLPKGYL